MSGGSAVPADMSSYHKTNGTYDTALQLTVFDPVMASIRHYDFADAAKDTPFYKEIIPAMLDYFETEHYLAWTGLLYRGGRRCVSTCCHGL